MRSRKNFHTISRPDSLCFGAREDTGVAGISMGGCGAVKLAIKHPALYGSVGTMSGALDITRRPASMR
jgi:S-formylglutathione hydrolase FrmB